MRVRAAGACDAEFLADLYLAAREGMTSLPRVHSDDQTRRWIAERVLVDDEVWVAEHGDARVLGFAALAGDMLDHLYVDPGAHGRGVGGVLLQKVKELRPCGFRLWVFQQNTGARRFYERHGLAAVELTDGAGNEEGAPDALYAWPGRAAVSPGRADVSRARAPSGRSRAAGSRSCPRRSP